MTGAPELLSKHKSADNLVSSFLDDIERVAASDYVPTDGEFSVGIIVNMS